ncbi:protein lin-37 homolog isoform X2 [Trichogramma pretiosum]|uniref:protein lin-37 homolog isoform X2 n=1 Tax=Trichogramma pretiosum TaxID=7493 RepID=UPI000C719C6D|nr:protein lin-37 homolog isoform X2 [Trichogramma pretiosum]
MGKKRPAPSSAADDFKLVDIKNEIDSTIGMARDRFKGALRELLHHSDEHNSSADSSDDTPMPEFKATPKKIHTPSKPKILNCGLPHRRTPMKRRRPTFLESAFHHTYVMKLFDRSVDLAQFEEDTPLYPICRAWMANQPRNPNFAPKARSPSPDVEREIIDSTNIYKEGSNEIRDVMYLPPPAPNYEGYPMCKIPFPVRGIKDVLDLDYENKTLKTKEVLMSEHTDHWRRVKKSFVKQAFENEKRYRESSAVLDIIFKRSSLLNLENQNFLEDA